MAGQETRTFELWYKGVGPPEQAIKLSEFVRWESIPYRLNPNIIFENVVYYEANGRREVEKLYKTLLSLARETHAKYFMARI